MRRLVAISDHCAAGGGEAAGRIWPADCLPPPPDRDEVRVTGGYLERLPLAAVASGLVDAAEVWSFTADPDASDAARGLWHGTPDPARPGLTRRLFHSDGGAPRASAEVLAHLDAAGAPAILCVWGLGVAQAILDACADAIRIYNSIDAPALRLPDPEAQGFDLYLTGADWQSEAIAARVPGARTLVLPIGPAFASGETFRPLGTAKDRDVVYVACTQPYKRHDLLLDTLAARPGTSALLVVGYGHLTEAIAAEAAARGLDVEIVGPLDHDAVNAAINRARVGIVCGVDDGAPAILTEYPLAGVPVLVNAALRCGTDFVLPETGVLAAEADFPRALDALLARAPAMTPRPAALAAFGWPASIARLRDALPARSERPRP